MLGVIEQALRHGDPSGRHGREPGGQLGGSACQVVGLDHLGDEAPGVRLRGGQPAAAREPLEGARGSKQAPDEVGAAGVGHEPDVDEGRHEGRRVGRDAQVAGAGKREPGAGCRSVHGGQDRLLERADREDVRVVVAAEA